MNRCVAITGWYIKWYELEIKIIITFISIVCLGIIADFLSAIFFKINSLVVILSSVTHSETHGMKISSFLSKSRHNICYFRWPLPHCEGTSRSTLRLSLHTRCPNRAGDIARFLASYGRLLEGKAELAQLRLDQIRSYVRQYFERLLKE